MVALNAKTEKRWWLWTPKLKCDGGSERRNWEKMVALNAETKMWLWTPKLRNDGGFECRNWEAMMALNVERKTNNGSERENENEQWLWMPKLKMQLWTPNGKRTTALNAKRKMSLDIEMNVWLWTLKMNDGSERRNDKCDDIELKANNDFECQIARIHLNAKMTMRLLMSN